MNTGKWLLLGAIIVFTNSISAQSWITNGLVAYYPFEGNADDASGTGNNGAVTAATLAADRFGRPSAAYEFDGATALISVADAPSLRISNDITVTCWLNFSQTNLNVRFVGKGGDCGRNYGLWGSSQPTATFWMFQQFPPEGGCVGCQENTASTVPTVQSGKWYQMVGVRSGGFSRLYLNGILLEDADAHPENCSAATYTGSEPLLIGAPGYIGGPGNQPDFMQGGLDDIRIYNRALSSNEVVQLYALESAPILNVRKAVYLDSANLWPGTSYQIQASTDLNTWTDQGSPFTATNSSWRSTNYWDVDNWNQLFFRLQVVP